MAKPKPPEIKSLGEYGSHIRAMIVAPSGFGKTVFGASDENVLFLTTDPEGTESAFFMGMEAEEWAIFEAKDLYDAYTWLRDGGASEYTWVVVDNAGEVEKILMKESMRLDREKKPHLDEFVPAPANYQRAQLSLIDFVKRMHELPVHILWTSHQSKIEDDDGVVYYAPAIHGQKGDIAQAVAGYMKVVGYGEKLDDEDAERRIWFCHHGPFMGKDRYSVLGSYRDDLTLEKLRKLYERKKQQVKSQEKASAAKKKAPVRRAATTVKRRK